MASKEFIACARCKVIFTRQRNEQRFCSMRCRQPSAAKRFWSNVNTLGPNECWFWTGGVDKNGYGRILAGHTVLSHRFAWELANGPIPEGMCVCHSCDNPPCCNVRHLWIGSVAMNNSDRNAKGRNSDRRGEMHPLCRLTTSEVLTIRKSTEPQDTLADRFGITQSNVSLIQRRKTWAHVT